MKVSDTPDEEKVTAGTVEASTERVWKVGTLTYNFRALTALFSWLLFGDFAVSVRERTIQVMAQLLFKKFGASDMLVGILTASVPNGLGLILGPITGYQSDRLRTRWGRRLPFLIVTTPLMVLGLLGLAFSPRLGGFLNHLLGPNSPGYAECALILAGASWVFFEIALMISNSVFGALVNDVVPHEVIGRFFGLFRAVSLIAGIIFFLGVMKAIGDHYSWVFLSVAILFGVGFMLMCFNVREGQYPPPDETPGSRKNVFTAVRTYFKNGFGHSLYIWYFAASILGNLATGPFNLYSLFYAQSLSLELKTYWSCLGLTYFISLGLAYPLGYLADRFHPLRVSFVAVVMYAAAMGCAYIFVHSASTFAVALVVHGVIVGTFNTSSASLGQRLLPRSKFAEISSAGGILYSFGAMLVPPLLGNFLDHHHDYRYVFLAALIMAAMASVAFTVLNAKFVAQGGPAHYHAPEPAAGDQRSQVSSAR
jgi:MFS family permease